MFRKRKKKIFPEGTFIPTMPRILSIIQLCLGFTALLFAASEPFMGEHFNFKSQILLHDYVMGKNNAAQAQLFDELPEEKKSSVVLSYKRLKEASNISFLNKLKNSFDIIFFKSSIFERSWILFAIIIPVLLLKKVEGATSAAWILPLIVTAYFISNEIKGKKIEVSEEIKLFPKEELLVDRYIKKNINALSFKDQQKELLNAWELYLIEDFAYETPSTHSNEFQKQVLKGEFAFNLARIERLPLPFSSKEDLKKQPWFLMIIYLVWNSLFAALISIGKYRPKLRQKNQEVQAG